MTEMQGISLKNLWYVFVKWLAEWMSSCLVVVEQ